MYDRTSIEALLPTVWHDHSWGLRNETAPDPDMPRAKTDPSHSGTLVAMLADIRKALAAGLREIEVVG